MAAAEKRENNMQTTWESDGRRAEPGRSAPSDSVGKHTTGWWCKNNLEKYEFVNGKDDIPYMKWTIKFMFETTTQIHILQSLLALL